MKRYKKVVPSELTNEFAIAANFNGQTVRNSEGDALQSLAIPDSWWRATGNVVMPHQSALAFKIASQEK